MSRIFLSHSHVDERQARALKRWLVAQNPPLDNEIFLDVDPNTGLRPGVKWKDALKQASGRCEVVICLVSQAWEASSECEVEFRTAENLDKRIICARLEPTAGTRITGEWQWVDLFGGGKALTEISLNGRHTPGDPNVVQFSTEGLRRLKDEIVGKGIGPETFVWPPPADPDRAPYRGWEPLDEYDAAVFFGRDAQLVRGLDQLRGMRQSGVETLFVILGPSGSGKSSFLRAGLLPRLRRDDRNFVVLDIVRPEGSVLTGVHGLAKSLHSTCGALNMKVPRLDDIRQACLTDANRVAELLRDIQQAAIDRFVEMPEGATPPTLILPVDQAEELFSVDAGDEAPRFLDLVRLYAESEVGERVPLIVAVTVRTDHYDSLQTAPQLNGVKSALFDDLKPMPQAEFKEVIEGPARRACEGPHPLEVEPELVQRLLHDCTAGADTLPMLALTLWRLYSDYGDDGDLQLDEYVSMGEMRNVVQTEVDNLLSRDPTERRAELNRLRTAFVPRLATVNADNDKFVRRTGVLYPWEGLDPETKALLDKFIDKRLLVEDAREDGGVVEVALESLLELWDDLRGWLEDEREDLKKAEILKRDATAWEKNQRDQAWLLQGRRLDEAEAASARLKFDDSVVNEFVRASKQRGRRRKVVTRGLLAIALIGALVAGFVGYELTNTSRRNTAWRLLSEADQILQGSRAGGDVRALQELLAAHALGATTADVVANSRRDELKILENPPKPDNQATAVHSVAASPDGGRIAWTSDDRTVRVWDSGAGMVTTLQTGGEFASQSVAMSGDGNWIAAATGDAKVRLWNAKTLAEEGNPMQHAKAVRSLSFNRDGEWIATGSEDGLVRVWDRATGRARFPRSVKHDGSVTTVAFSPTADQIVSGSTDTTVRLLDAASGSEITRARPDPQNDGPVESVAFDSSGDRIAVARSNGVVQLLDGHSLDVLSAFDTRQGDVKSVAFQPGGDRIVTGGSDNTVRVWDPMTRTPIGNPLFGHHGRVTSVIYSADGAEIVSGGSDGSVRVWDAITGLPIPAGQGREIRAVAFHPDSRGAEMASGGTDGTVKLWDSRTGTERGKLGAASPGFTGAINSLAYNDDGSLMVTGSRDGTIRVWDLKTRRPLKDLVKIYPPLIAQPPAGDLGARIQSVAFSPDGTLIAAAGNDGVVRLWDARTFRPLAAEIAHGVNRDGKDLPYQVWSVAFSPDGQRLATGSGYDHGGYDVNFLQLWHVDRFGSQPLGRDGDPIVDHQNWIIYGVAFDATGRRVASSSYDGTVRVFDTESRQRLALMTSDHNPVYAVAFAHDDKHPWMATTSSDGNIRLWDTESYAPIGTPLTGHQGKAAVAFSADDQRILSGAMDGNIHLWPAPRDLNELVCSKLTANMSRQQWHDWVSANPFIRYEVLCPGLPVPE